LTNLKKELYNLTAIEANHLIRSGEITVQNYIKSIIQRIEKINPSTNAWVHLDSNKVLEHARRLDRYDLSERTSPLFGIPIGIKDIFNTEDFPTSMGSPLWDGFTSGNDARVIYNIRMAEGIILGKTETAEFAVHALGKSKNPYDNVRSPGTSSSGSAIAVATSTVPLALGTQTAGSIIRPASYCGIYGFKPSFGLIPRTGMLKTTDSLDQIGYFARNPQDLELLLDIIRVKGSNYPLVNESLTDEKRQNITNRPWKIKFVKSSVWDKAESYAQKYFLDFINNLSKFKNFDVSEYILPKEFDLAHETHNIIYLKSLAYYFKEELKNKTLVSKIFYDLAESANKISLNEFDKAISYQAKLIQLLDNAFNDFDIIISLSTTGHAPFRDEKEKDDPSLIWTMCSVPAINMPAIKTEKKFTYGYSSYF